MMSTNPEETLRIEFNEWAGDGRGESMERGHGPVGIQAIEEMGITENDVILDLGCGNGWASRAMAKVARRGEVVGVDISDEMIRIAEKASTGFGNIRYVVSGAEKTP